MEKKSFCFKTKLSILEPGQIISFTGKTTKDAESFEFFLGSSDPSNDEMQFHVTVKFAGGCQIEIKRQESGNFQEVKQTCYPGTDLNSIKSGENFQIDVIIGENQIVLVINLNPYCSFVYQNSLRASRRLTISGDLERIYEVHHLSQKDIILPKFSEFKETIVELNANAAILVGGFLKECEVFHVKLQERESGLELMTLKICLKSKEISVNDE